MRALDAMCESPSCCDSARTVVQLGKLPLATRKSYLKKAIIWDLGNVVRCVLEEVSADVRFAETKNETALSVAARKGSARALKGLLKGGANCALADEEGTTPLSDAARVGELLCVCLLLDAGADPTASDFLGNTPLMQAIMSKHADCARALLPVSDLLQTARDGLNAFHASVHTASEEGFALLLPLMVDVDVRTVPAVDTADGDGQLFGESALFQGSDGDGQGAAGARR